MREAVRPARVHRQKGRAWRSYFTAIPIASRRAILKASQQLPIAAMQIAAVAIQRQWRGYQVRALRPKGYAVKQTSHTPSIHRRRSRRRSSGALLTRYVNSIHASGSWHKESTGGFSEWCAVRVQAAWRMCTVYRRFAMLKHRIYHVAASEIQRQWHASRGAFLLAAAQAETGGCIRTDADGAALSQHDAARSIQGAWKSFTSRRIYVYFRDLIRFRLAGDPAQLLRTINPPETYLFDRAAAVHVRFRLGGASFPPNIYYKVYTHAPVADIGAFAPRHYCQKPDEMRKRACEGLSGRLHRMAHESKSPKRVTGTIRVGSSFFGTTMAVDPSRTPSSTQWYERVESNGWRPITMKVLAGSEKDAITEDTDKVTMPFHHTKSARQSGVASKAKEARRRWLMTMHKQGLAACAGTTAEDYCTSPGEQKDEGCKNAAPPASEFTDGDLILWSSALDYDGYLRNWKCVATSGPSEPYMSAAATTSAGRGPDSSYGNLLA
eukprot:TRINITY_DN6417_c0_g1_i1.p1 TRINITY_DN6417_c0_g1~~TRINITY_DN6417_c0_g1_i1.p1  ORF type:complete len:494 (-),score=65.78 TRINITY_DN6417_c0_g1_i1:285-1766(-)